MPAESRYSIEDQFRARDAARAATTAADPRGRTMNESVSAELRERARLRRVQGAEAVSVDEIREWLTAEARASEHPFTRRVAAGALAELDAARARVAELEAENERREVQLVCRIMGCTWRYSPDETAGPSRRDALLAIAVAAGEHIATHTPTEWRSTVERLTAEQDAARARVAELEAIGQELVDTIDRADYGEASRGIVGAADDFRAVLDATRPRRTDR